MSARQGEQPVLAAGDEDDRELQAHGRVQGIDQRGHSRARLIGGRARPPVSSLSQTGRLA